MIYIEEKQYFRQKWLWVIILFFPLFSFYGIYEQIMLGNPIGNNPASDMTIRFSTTILFHDAENKNHR